MARKPISEGSDADPTKYIPPTDPAKLIAWLNAKREAGKQRIPDTQMRMSMAMVLGHQWAIWDKGKGMFRTPNNRPNDPNPPVRITANKIGTLVEMAIAKLTKGAPEPEVRPVSDDEKDVDAAKVGTRILSHELNRLHWSNFLTGFMLWPITLGHSFIHVYWDPNDGPVVGSVDEQDLQRGEIVIEEVPAFELSVDPNASSMLEALWALRTTSWTKEAVWEQYGKIPEGAEYGRSLADDVYALATGGEGVSGVYDSKNNSEYVFVHQFWLKPGRAAPQGMVVTWSGNTILEGPMKYPYDHKELPFVQQNFLPGMGTREGRTWVNDLIPLQIDYNDARSREATIRRLLTPKILAPAGSIDPARVTSRVEIITYNPTGAVPTFFHVDSGWMAQYEAGMSRADNEMGDRAGRTPMFSQRISAAAIMAIQAEADTKLIIPANELAAAMERVGWHMLQLIRQFWVEKRLVRTWSDDGLMEVQHYMNSDVVGQLDIYVSSEAAAPRTAAARQQIALELSQRGIPPFNDPRVLLRYMDIPGADLISDALNVDTREAHVENALLLSGQQVEVRDFQNHPVHKDEHDRVRKGADYKALSPQGKAVFDAHVAVHEELIAQQAAAAQASGQLLPGQKPPNEVINAKDVPPDVAAQMEKQAGLNPAIPAQHGAQGQGTAAPEDPAAAMRKRAGIGGPGQPGQVPGVSTAEQAQRMGG